MRNSSSGIEGLVRVFCRGDAVGGFEDGFEVGESPRAVLLLETGKAVQALGPDSIVLSEGMFAVEGFGFEVGTGPAVMAGDEVEDEVVRFFGFEEGCEFVPKAGEAS